MGSGFVSALTTLVVPVSELSPKPDHQRRLDLHYYQFNIGDYASHTSRLCLQEDLAYRRLLDLYYLNERPFNDCLKDVARDIGMLDSSGDVEYILNKFFVLKDGYWHQERADREIEAYKSKQKSASKAGKASAKARQLKASERTLNKDSTDVQPNIKHKPITNNHKPIKTRAVFKKPAFIEVLKYCRDRQNKVDPQEFIDHYEANGWMRGKTKIKCWKACVRTWEKNANEKTTINNRNNETPTDRSRVAANKLRRQQQTYSENSTLIQINDRPIRE